MIVLDEHLRGLGVDTAIARWYRGRVLIITDFRPATVIKDDAIPALLSEVSQPTFVTLNWSHFWKRTAAHTRFCLVCFAMSTNRATEIPTLLRRLFSLHAFKTKTRRMGKVARISAGQVAYYQLRDNRTYLLPI